MDDLLKLFPDVADALEIESVAIVEKDYDIVELLRLLKPLSFDTHQLVFAGGTALSKAGFLHGQEDFDIVRGDTLREPKFLQKDRLETFDCVIANPPFSLKEWGYDLWSSDPYGRKQ